MTHTHLWFRNLDRVIQIMPCFLWRQYFVVVFKDKPFELWDLRSGTMLRQMPKNFPHVTALASILQITERKITARKGEWTDNNSETCFFCWTGMVSLTQPQEFEEENDGQWIGIQRSIRYEHVHCRLNCRHSDCCRPHCQVRQIVLRMSLTGVSRNLAGVLTTENIRIAFAFTVSTQKKKPLVQTLTGLTRINSLPRVWQRGNTLCSQIRMDCCIISSWKETWSKTDPRSHQT